MKAEMSEQIRELCTRMLVAKSGPEFDSLTMELANALERYQDLESGPADA